MFCGKRDEFKRGRRTIEKSKNGPVREKSKTAKNKQIEKDRVSTFWYFFVVFDVFLSSLLSFFYLFAKNERQKNAKHCFSTFWVFDVSRFSRFSFWFFSTQNVHRQEDTKRHLEPA